MKPKARREPVGASYILEFYLPNLRYKRLLSLALNFITMSDRDGVIDLSYPVPATTQINHCRTYSKNINFKEN